MIVEVAHTVHPAEVLEGFCSEEVYDVVKTLDPMTFEIEVAINRDDEITEVYPGPDGCATALYLGLLPTIESRLKAGEYQEIVQALRIHERKYHNEDLPTEALRVLRGRLEAIEERAI
jgi:hypothetical protein